MPACEYVVLDEWFKWITSHLDTRGDLIGIYEYITNWSKKWVCRSPSKTFFPSIQLISKQSLLFMILFYLHTCFSSLQVKFWSLSYLPVNIYKQEVVKLNFIRRTHIQHGNLAYQIRCRVTATPYIMYLRENKTRCDTNKGHIKLMFHKYSPPNKEHHLKKTSSFKHAAWSKGSILCFWRSC